jgi:hypothetical protein
MEQREGRKRQDGDLEGSASSQARDEDAVVLLIGFEIHLLVSARSSSSADSPSKLDITIRLHRVMGRTSGRGADLPVQCQHRILHVLIHESAAEPGRVRLGPAERLEDDDGI